MKDGDVIQEGVFMFSPAGLTCYGWTFASNGPSMVLNPDDERDRQRVLRCVLVHIAQRSGVEVADHPEPAFSLDVERAAADVIAMARWMPQGGAE